MSSSPVSVWCSASSAGSAGATDLPMGEARRGPRRPPPREDMKNPQAAFSSLLDHAVFLERLDGGGIEAKELAVDLRAVLAQERRAGDLGGGVGHAHGIARDVHVPAMRMLDRHDHPAVDE